MFDVYVWMSEMGVVLLLVYVFWSDVCKIVVRDEVIGFKEIVCNCVIEDDVEILVEFVVVIDVVICDEVVFLVVKLVCCRWCVVFIVVVLNDLVIDGFFF